MNAENVKRLLIVVGAGVGDPQDQPGLMDKLINGLLKMASRQLYDAMKGVASAIRDADVDWTLVRVPMLTDSPGTGSIRKGYLGGGIGSRLSREDLARFMLAELEKSAYLRQAPV
ncbi:MAG: NAD(P)H-binding protein, partial [Anaerolineae bacterium]|nr:NAD(P)H-binding protein [Anaerolineae bacterium]